MPQIRVRLLDLSILKDSISTQSSKDMLDFSFRGVNSEVFNELDRKSFLGKEKQETYFNHKRSILYIKGKKVLINRQEKITNAHKLLHHIFITNKKNLDDEFFYAEIAEDEFDDPDYRSQKNAWKRYYRACEIVNQKIDRQTDREITDFLVYNTGRRGNVTINKKYL